MAQGTGYFAVVLVQCEKIRSCIEVCEGDGEYIYVYIQYMHTQSESESHLHKQI